MATVPHAVPSRTAHAIAALYGHEDETLIAWQRFCAQAAEALRPQPDPERLSKALALAQGGHVEVEDDGFAVVTSGTKLYHVQADGSCDCPDYQNRRTSCKHVLAVLIHARAQELVAPSPSPAPTAAASSAPAQAPTPTKPTRQAKPRHSAAWDVHEAPFSSCFKIRLGALEWTHTIRASDDAEGQARLHAFLPTFRDIAAALEALHAEREAAKAAPAAPAAPTPPPATPAAVPQADLQAVVQQAVQQALAAANGQAHGTPPPAAPSTGQRQAKAKTGDQATGFCSLHNVAMEHRENERGSWYSHWLPEDERHCKGRR